MSDAPENPRAFPLPVSDNNLGYEGMSLRDYFAAHAMACYIALKPTNFSTNAVCAYEQADAMLRERQS